MKARELSLAERAFGRRPRSPFPRPRTIVAIIRDKDERIDVDEFPGIVGSADYLAGTPESVRLRILAKYVADLARQWAAYEALKHPTIAVLMADALIEIKGEEVSATNSSNASKLRKPVTKADLDAYREAYKERGALRGLANPMRGWQTAACLEFNIDRKTLRKRMAE